MTGFGRASARDGGWQAEVRAVNHRYLDVAVRVPDGYRVLEPPIRAAVGAVVQRGRVEVAVVAPAAPTARRLVVDTVLASSYHEALKEIADMLGVTADAPAAMFLGLSGVCTVREAAPSAETVWVEVAPVLASALDEMTAMRAREGSSLQGVLLAQVDALSELCARVAVHLPDAQRQQRDRWRERWAAWTSGADFPEGLLPAMERGDVAEEVARARSHLDQARAALVRDGPAGRRLDFLAQELQREWTTVAAKALDAEIAQLALEARVTADQLREQAQNVE